MFSIGQHLADERRRRGLSLEECEAATRIRARHLLALEDDRPDDIPDPVYARLFLRGYASFLGLDADALVAELDERRGTPPPVAEHRLVPAEDPPEGAAGRLWRWMARPRRRSMRRQGVWVTAGMLGALGVVLWLGARSEPPAPTPVMPVTTGAAPEAAPVVAAPTARRPRAARLVLTGAGTEGSYVRVHRGDATGPVLHDGVLAPGRRLRFALSGPLWMRVGWTPSLRVTLAGRAVALEGGTGDFLVTRRGVEPAP